MNFALTPKSIPTEEITQSVEPTLRRHDKTAANDVWVKMSEVLRRAKPAKPNLSKEEISALHDIKRDSNIHILSADKGNAMQSSWIDPSTPPRHMVCVEPKKHVYITAPLQGSQSHQFPPAHVNARILQHPFFV